MGASDRTLYQGHTVDRLTLQIITTANRLLRLGIYGHETGDVTMMQGSWNKGVGASAGTHDKGAVFDLTPYNWQNRVKVLRLLGVAYWDRPAIKGVWPHHGHGVVSGMGDAAFLAQQQVVAYNNGRNGLANNGRDQDWRPRVLPLAVYNGNTGVKTASVNTQGRTQPTYLTSVTRKIPKGTHVDVLMELNVAGKRWSVTDRGDFVPSWKLA